MGKRKRYSKFEIDKIKRKPILEVAKELGLEIKRKKTKCFLHEEKTPSLSFDTKNNSWKCFGCGEKGDVIGLVMKKKDIKYPEALAWLNGDRVIASSRGIKPIRRKTIKNKTNKKKPNSEIYKHFHSLCIDDPKIFEFYKNEKGIKDEVLKNAQIKLLGDNKIIMRKLRQSWSNQQLMNCGLFKEKVNKTTGEIFTTLIWFKQNTAIIPFFNEKDAITFLKGRILEEKNEHRNLENIKTEIYNRQIIKELKHDDQLFICEGETDTLSALSIGKNAIGILGANNFKKEYVELLKDFQIFIAPDNDEAGHNFFETIRNAFWEIGKSVERTKIPSNYKDLNQYYYAELSD